MSTFFMFGKYSQEALKKISAKRTKKAVEAIEKFSGKIVSMYALLGEYDLLLIVDFPKTEEVMKASVALNQLTGISFTTLPAISVESFDKIVENL